jgi:hypothetical protein
LSSWSHKPIYAADWLEIGTSFAAYVLEYFTMPISVRIIIYNTHNNNFPYCHMLLTRHGVKIGNWICWIPVTSNYG